MPVCTLSYGLMRPHWHGPRRAPNEVWQDLATDREPDVAFCFLPPQLMENALTMYEHIVLDMIATFGLMFFVVVLFFPKWIVDKQKPNRMEQCTQCGKWSKA